MNYKLKNEKERKQEKERIILEVIVPKLKE
jgi:hypothetical protein